MRYLMITSVSRVSMWMSLGPALDGVEDRRVDQLDDRAGVGGDAVDREDLLAVLVLLDELDAEVLGRLVEHALGALRLLQDLLDRRAHAHLDLDRLAEQQLQLVDLEHVRRVGHDHRQAAVELRLGDEAVAQHQVERDAAEQVVVDPEVRHVDELEPVARGEGLRLAPLAARAARAPARRSRPSSALRPSTVRSPLATTDSFTRATRIESSVRVVQVLELDCPSMLNSGR